MNTKLLKLGLAFSAAALFLVTDANAQWGRRGGYYPGPYGMMRPRVHVGIGGVFGGGYYGYGPRVGVSVGVGFPGGGIYVSSLPVGYRRIYVGGAPYYYYRDRYYVQRGGRYQVIDAPLGSTLRSLPAGAQRQVINGETFYELNGTYLQEDRNANGNRVYVVVGTNGRLDTKEARRRMADNAERYQNDRERDYNYNEQENGNDDAYNNRSSNGDIVVRNANRDEAYNSNANSRNDVYDSGDGAYSAHPQSGDQFDQLPKDSRAISVDGKRQYVSPAGTYYKEVTIDGRTVYEVVRSK